MWLWLVVALLAAIGEVLTTGLFLGIMAMAAVVTAVLALVIPQGVQVVAFAGLSLSGIVFIRPVLMRSMGRDTLSHSAGRILQSHVVGRRATVTQTVDTHSGQIRIGNGEFWSARAYEPGEVIPAGAPVEIVVVDGITALVTPVLPLTLEENSVANVKGTIS